MSEETNPRIRALINELKGLLETIEKNPKINPWVIRKTLKTIIDRVDGEQPKSDNE